MRVPFLRSSPAVRSSSNTSKRRVFLAGLVGGVDPAAGSLAFANFLPPRTQWGRSSTRPRRAKPGSVSSTTFVLKLSHPPRRYNTPVSAVSPQPDQQPSRKRPDKLRIYKLEAGGILISGALIL